MKKLFVTGPSNRSLLPSAGVGSESTCTAIQSTKQQTHVVPRKKPLAGTLAGWVKNHLLIAAGAISVFHAIPLQARQINVRIDLSGEKCSLRLIQIEGAFYGPSISCTNSTITVDPLEFLTAGILGGSNNTFSINGGSISWSGRNSIIGHDNFLFLISGTITQNTGCYNNVVLLRLGVDYEENSKQYNKISQIWFERPTNGMVLSNDLKVFDVGDRESESPSALIIKDFFGGKAQASTAPIVVAQSIDYDRFTQITYAIKNDKIAGLVDVMKAYNPKTFANQLVPAAVLAKIQRTINESWTSGALKGPVVIPTPAGFETILRNSNFTYDYSTQVADNSLGNYLLLGSNSTVKFKEGDALNYIQVRGNNTKIEASDCRNILVDAGKTATVSGHHNTIEIKNGTKLIQTDGSFGNVVLFNTDNLTNREQLWLVREGNDLEISNVADRGATKLTLKGFFVGDTGIFNGDSNFQLSNQSFNRVPYFTANFKDGTSQAFVVAGIGTLFSKPEFTELYTYMTSRKAVIASGSITAADRAYIQERLKIVWQGVGL